ncbi:hypothetical protein N8D56_22890 [Devosia sp. A8/3-2]|nr:hypothetical protein N8D56_22890 [Devosia sp. A8/3-2]
MVAKDAVRKFLSKLNRERGTTIILTTHDLQDIEEICPRLIMVDEGKLLFDGEVTRLRAALGSRRRLTLTFGTDPGIITTAGAQLVSDEGAAKHFLLDSEDISILNVLTELGSGYDLSDVALEEPDIEEVIRTFTRTSPNWPGCSHEGERLSCFHRQRFSGAAGLSQPESGPACSANWSLSSPASPSGRRYLARSVPPVSMA